MTEADDSVKRPVPSEGETKPFVLRSGTASDQSVQRNEPQALSVAAGQFE